MRCQIHESLAAHHHPMAYTLNRDEVLLICLRSELLSQHLPEEVKKAAKQELSELEALCIRLRAYRGNVMEENKSGFPMQPIVITDSGVVRFKENRQVSALLDAAQKAGFGLNELACLDHSDEERMQLAQLIGYSVSGYGTLLYVSEESANRADSVAAELLYPQPEQAEPAGAAPSDAIPDDHDAVVVNVGNGRFPVSGRMIRAILARFGAQPAVPAIERYNAAMVVCDEPDPLERLRFFCSIAMRPQDWLDVEPFFAALAAQPAAQGAEPVRGFLGKSAEEIAKLRDSGLKPEEIAGDPETQMARVRELISWFVRLSSGHANPKWLRGHAFELAYFIACMDVNRLAVAPAGAEKADAGDAALTQAARDVLAERRRQVESEGWTPEHDDAYGKFAKGELERAAACYASAAGGYTLYKVWPWSEEWWKPGDGRRMLVKAAALTLAAIERRDRQAAALAASGTSQDGGAA